MNVRYRLLNNEGKLLFSNLHPEEIALIEKIDKVAMIAKSDKSDVRCGFLKNSSGIVYAASTDQDYINSSKKFTWVIRSLGKTLEAIQVIFQDYQNKVNVNTSRLLHNLTSLNAHNIQEIYSLVPQESLAKSAAGEQIEIVERAINKDPRDASLAILRIAKNNAAMKTEFSVFNKLFDANPRLEKKSHNVHKVLMNVLYLFFPDFTDKSVNVRVSCPENTMAFFDYESIHVAFYHLIENAVKYVKPNTELAINIASINNLVTMRFSMISLSIERDEIQNIFEEGFSGSLAKQLGKSGSGIGMTRAKNILEINGANIAVESDASSQHAHFGVPYQTNIFIIKLNVKK